MYDKLFSYVSGFYSKGCSQARVSLCRDLPFKTLPPASIVSDNLIIIQDVYKQTLKIIEKIIIILVYVTFIIC